MAISRRNFLGSVGAVTAAAVGSAVPASFAAPAPAKFDETVDILVIGTGFAGLACALQARKEGIKEILVLDKMPIPGGNSIINGGAVAATGTDMQKAAGIEDNPDKLFADIGKAGGGLAHPELARVIADNCVENYEWLRNEVGVKFKAVYFHGGHAVPRSHATVQNSGAGFILPMLDRCKEQNITIRQRCKVVALLTNEKNEVVGVKAKNGYKFGHEDTGTEINIAARGGVVICAGGFCQNVEMRTRHDPRLDAKFSSTNHPGATGDLVQAAQMIGANTVHMDWIQLGPWTSPDENGFGVAPLFVEASVGFGPMIDPATGKRFVKETGNRKVRADAIVAIGHPCLIYNSEPNVMKKIVNVNMTPEMFQRSMDRGVVKKFATLEDMAKEYSIPLDELKKTNETFNGYMKAMKDPEFDCMFFKDGVPNEKGPFYACRLWPRVHHCMGGLDINAQAQVLDATCKPIKGLYAAGEATGGVHGAVRLGTVAVADCMIFGRTAARQIAKALKA